MKNRPILALVCAAALALMVGACGDDTPGTNENNNTPICNNDGVCDEPDETRVNCPNDCFVACSLTDGDEYDYIITELYIPTNASEARTVGVDIDGDGDIDNKLGQIMSLIPADSDPNVAIQESIQQGDIIILGRMVVDPGGFPDTDPEMAVQIFLGDSNSGDATADNLTGYGSVLIDDASDRTLHLCGSITGGYLTAGPDTLNIQIAVMGIMLSISLDRAQMVSDGTVDASGWTEVMVGGGISRETMENELMPTLVAYLNDEIVNDPDGSVWEFVRDSIDCRCENALQGCETIINEEGDCACWGGAGDPTDPVTVTELMCNTLLNTALDPDVDIDGDGEGDLLSLGIRVSAISAYIAN